jgi:hypothetical protein
MRLEAASNHLYAHHGATAMCAYDAGHLPDFLIAVNEVVTNALVHGLAPRRLTLTIDDLVCRVRALGPWDAQPAGRLPAPGASGSDGRELWVATTLTDVLEIATGDGGTQVSPRLRLADA